MNPSSVKKVFNKQAEKVAFDKAHRNKINFNISKYNKSVAEGKTIYKDIELARNRAGHIKYKMVSELDKEERELVNRGEKKYPDSYYSCRINCE